MSWLEKMRSQMSPEYGNFLETLSVSESRGDFVLLYGCTDLEERNSTFEIVTYLPDWLAIGDDSSGTALLMRRDGSAEVYACGHGALGSVEPERVSDSFVRWLDDGCPVSWMDEDFDDDHFGDDDLDDDE